MYVYAPAPSSEAALALPPHHRLEQESKNHHGHHLEISVAQIQSSRLVVLQRVSLHGVGSILLELRSLHTKIPS
jgi:hypothetical protein